MKKISIIFSFLILASIGLFAQFEMTDPVTWKTRSIDKGAGNYELIFSADIDKPWHMYAIKLEQSGPIPTTFSFKNTADIELKGEVKEITKPVVKFDEGFRFNIGAYYKHAEFSQKVHVNSPGKVTLEASVEYQCCDDETCLPPFTKSFEIELVGIAATKEISSTGVNQTKAVAGDNIAGKAAATEEGANIKNAINPASSEKDSDNSTLSEEVQSITVTPANKEKVLLSEPEEGKSLTGFLILTFLLGLAAILTPCVYPMIPMTISFFMRGAENRGFAIVKGLVFGLSMILVYTGLGALVALSGMDANFGNIISTHWIPNIIFFLLFMVFEAAGGAVMKPILGMFFFSLAFALPFTILAIFPSMMKNLPKSGGWLNAVKVVLGFMMMAFGMKFLSAIDQSYHLNFFSREVYLSIWFVIAFMLGLYLLGKLRLQHDNDLPYISVPRLLLAMASFVFALYIFTGIFGNELRSISSMIPPRTSQSFSISPSTPVSEEFKDNSSTFCGPGKYDEIFNMPYGLNAYYNYEDGMKCAKELNKPVFIDFTGHSCSNCKQMEAQVWSDPAVLKRLREDFVIISLYTDDKTKLPENEWLVSDDGKVLKTIGEVNVNFEIKNFETFATPWYVLMDNQGNILTPPIGKEMNVGKFVEFLDRGIGKAE